MSQVLVGQPLDTIKVRLQLDQGKFKGAWDCAVQTVQKEGFFALYKGKTNSSQLALTHTFLFKVWPVL